MTERKKPVGPWLPPTYESADVHALQRLAEGTAGEADQKRALNWIVYQAAGAYDMTFWPESDRHTSFAEGKRFVGLQIVKLLKIDRERIKQAENRKQRDAVQKR